MEDNEIKVSVYCLAYNHEKYIRKTLEGFVMQKTDFKYEVFVHDDASTDGTAAIIKEYAEKYPDIIKPIFQTENQYSKGIKITRTFIYPLMKGKYIAMCEGDDCWTDENKLQLQYDAMERNSNCSICAHYVSIYEKNEIMGVYPVATLGEGVVKERQKALELNFKDYIQTSSYFLRMQIFREYYEHPPKFVNMMPVGDNAMRIFAMEKGDLYFINKTMSLYRRETEGSWSNRMRTNIKANIKHHKEMIDSLNECIQNFVKEDYFRQVLGKSVISHEFDYFYYKKEYKKLMSKRYKDRLKTYPYKFRLKLYVMGVFPHLITWYDKRKDARNVK